MDPRSRALADDVFDPVSGIEQAVQDHLVGLARVMAARARLGPTEVHFGGGR